MAEERSVVRGVLRRRNWAKWWLDLGQGELEGLLPLSWDGATVRVTRRPLSVTIAVERRQPDVDLGEGGNG